LTETNVSDVETQQELEDRIRAGAFLGTLQAGYTDFHYLREVWRTTTEEDSLLGVGITGVGSGKVLTLDLTAAAKVAVEENERVAKLIGIKKAKRVTTLKPAGSTSCVLGTSSGVHAWYNDYYIRRMRVGKNEALYQYMLDNLPELVEDCQSKPHIEAVLSFPQKAPEGALLRTETALTTLERVKKLNQEWITPGHIEGDNMHNVSCTISVRDEEWETVGAWMWDNKDFYTGIAVLNYDGGSYTQAPFEDCSKEVYEKMMGYLKDIDLSKVVEEDDNTNLNDQAACGGGACEVK